MKKNSVSCIAIGLLISCMAAVANDPYTDIITHQQNGDYQQALAQISHLLTQNQDDVQALLLKGNVTKLMGNSAAASGIFKQLIKQYPKMPEAYNNLAVLYADNGQTALAIETLQQVFATRTSYATAYKNLRALYDEMASSAYRDALDIENKPQKKQGQFALLNTTRFTTASAVVKTSAQQSPPVVTEAVTEVAAVEKVEKKVKSAAVEKADSAALERQVTTMVKKWAQAWSKREVASYFAFYHPQFKPPQSMSRKRWESYRGKRLTRPKFIEIDVVGLALQPRNDDLVTVIFEQHYRSDSYKDTVVKKLTLKRHQGQWLIAQEVSL